LLNYEFTISDPRAASAALAQLVGADAALAARLAMHLESAVRGFGRPPLPAGDSFVAAVSDNERSAASEARSSETGLLPHARKGRKDRGGSRTGRIGAPGHLRKEPLEGERRRRLVEKVNEASVAHRYQKLVEMPW
jgi:hypothetical protein